MLAAVTSGLTTVIGWVGTVITALTGQSGELADLLPLFAIGIAISAVLLGMIFDAELKALKNGETPYRSIPCQALK